MYIPEAYGVLLDKGIKDSLF